MRANFTVAPLVRPTPRWASRHIAAGAAVAAHEQRMAAAVHILVGRFQAQAFRAPRLRHAGRRLRFERRAFTGLPRSPRF